MSTFTKQFSSADEYEEWLRKVGERINVLTITNPAGTGVYRPRTLWIKGARNPSEVRAAASGQPASAEITVKYQTSDPTLAPAKNKNAVVAQIAIVAAAFFALFIYAILKF